MGGGWVAGCMSLMEGSCLEGYEVDTPDRYDRLYNYYITIKHK